ncbi:hypothetical protein ACP4OV_023507 [Aristida adscensionis]
MRKAAAAMGGGGGGGGKGAGTAPADLLVCFPARQRLALMPKPICSPNRATLDKAAAARRRQSQPPGARSSPMFRGSRAKHTAAEEEEPQSPKVTCAGQIKVGRPKKPRPTAAAAAGRTKREGGGGGGGRSWVTVVEEIERLHGRRKKVGWLEAVGIRRDALPFLGGALRSLRLKARCFGSLHGAVDSSSSTDDGNDGDGVEEWEGERGAGGGGSAAASVFSKWLMVLEGSREPPEPESYDDDDEGRGQDDDDDERQRSKGTDECPAAPPPNALLLMRCRSAPAKGLSRRVADAPPADVVDDVEQENGGEDAVAGPGDGGAVKAKDELVFMSTAPGFVKLSIDIAKETWVVGGMYPLARSRSWKR